MATGLVTIASTADVLDSVPEPLDLLTDAERDRAARLRRIEDRLGFVAAHLLVRLCATHLLGLPPATPVVQRCPSCGGAHGPPHLLEHPQAGVSLSHADGVVAAAVAPTPVGVDVEPLASARGLANLAPGIASRAEALAAGGPDTEAALLLLWVRKEALVKLRVTTLDAMSDLDLSDLPLVPPTGGRHRRVDWSGYRVVDLSLEAPAALGAVVSPAEIEVVPLDRLRRAAAEPCRPTIGQTISPP